MLLEKSRWLIVILCQDSLVFTYVYSILVSIMDLISNTKAWKCICEGNQSHGAEMAIDMVSYILS